MYFYYYNIILYLFLKKLFFGKFFHKSQTSVLPTLSLLYLCLRLLLLMTTSSSVEEEKNIPDLRISFLGNVDSGKSTIVGVLSKYVLDDGRGFARSHVLQHKHEKEKGQSSAVSLELMGFEANGNAVLPTKLTGKHTRDFRDISSRSSHLISIIDLCGHEGFLKTTVFGLMGLMPDVVFLLVGANAGVQKDDSRASRIGRGSATPCSSPCYQN